LSAAIDIEQAEGTIPSKARAEGPARIEADHLDLLRQIDTEIDKVSPEFSQLASTVRQFASRYLSGETPYGATIGVVSANPGEGRTTVSFELAGALADIYASVVLVELGTSQDALAMSAEMNLKVTSGLGEYLDGEAELEDIIQPTRKSNLSLITAGKIDQRASRLGATTQIRELLTILGKEFAIVIVDVPPLLANEESPALLGNLNGIVVVVAASTTTMDEVSNTLRLCDSIPVRGILLNRVSKRTPKWLASVVNV